MNREEALKLAHSKIDHEHSRWNTWALFLFGSIISASTLWFPFRDTIPAHFLCFTFAFLSFLWVLVALGLRRVTWSWVKVINYIERSDGNQFRANQCYQDYEKRYRPLNKENLFPKGWYYRVSVIMTLFGIGSSVVFVFLGILLLSGAIGHDLSKRTAQNTYLVRMEHFSDILDNSQRIIQVNDDIQHKLHIINRKLDDIEKKVAGSTNTNFPNARRSTD